MTPRSSYQLMFAPVFGPFFWGKVLASIGIWINNIVAAVVTYEITASALMVGLVSAAQFAPQLLLAPLSGRATDRGNAVAQLVLGRTLTAVGASATAVWIWLAGDLLAVPGYAPMLGSLVVGLGSVLGGPAMHSLVPGMVRREELAAAMALTSVPMIVSRAGGPVLGAILATEVGPATAFGVAAGANLTFAVIIVALRLPGSRSQASDVDYTVRASLRYVRSHRALLLGLIGITAVGAGADPVVTLGPALARQLEGGAGLVGFLASAFGAGAALGFILFARLNAWLGVGRVSVLGLSLMSAGLFIAALSDLTVVTLTGFGAGGVGMTLAFTSLTTDIQQRLPDSLRGRVMALWMVGFLGSRPISAAATGWLADMISVGAALGTVGALVLGAAILSSSSVGSRSGDNPVTEARPAP